MPIHGYEKIVDVLNDKYSINNHLLVETTIGIYFVDAADQTKVYSLDVATGITTQIDIDPSDSSGDNKSRDHAIRAIWHDRANEILYVVDGENDGVENDFDHWTLDYSGGTLISPSVTELGAGGTLEVYATDIFINDGTPYVITNESDGELTPEPIMRIYDVSSHPFVKVAEVGLV